MTLSRAPHTTFPYSLTAFNLVCRLAVMDIEFEAKCGKVIAENRFLSPVFVLEKTNPVFAGIDHTRYFHLQNPK